MFVSVANMMQMHVYTYSKHGKCHNVVIDVANVAFTYYLCTGVNMYLHQICHTGNKCRSNFSSSVCCF